MEGLVDDLLREILTSVGGIDWCVTEFVRIGDQLLPPRVFHRMAPELLNGGQTKSGTPVHLQLLGSDPVCLAENAALACELGAPVIDLNFGCPAKTVNRSRGGAILLNEPELLYDIVHEVRRAVPRLVPVTAKMRLGYECTGPALDCARALEAGGAAQIVVHARTKVEGYRPPAHWEWIARVQEVVSIPVYANGEIWTIEDWQRCSTISGAERVMLGRGLIARPSLALEIRAVRMGTTLALTPWEQMELILRGFWTRLLNKPRPGFAPGRLKQWLVWLGRTWPEAAELFNKIRRLEDPARITALLEKTGERVNQRQ